MSLRVEIEGLQRLFLLLSDLQMTLKYFPGNPHSNITQCLCDGNTKDLVTIFLFTVQGCQIKKQVSLGVSVYYGRD